MAEPLTPAPILHPIVEPSGLTPRPWARWFLALQEQAGTPGPAGPQGEPGPAGPAGPQGEPGADATPYTNEQAQDAVGSILVDSLTINVTYDDITPTIGAQIVNFSVSTLHLAYHAVLFDRMQQIADGRLLGRSAGSAGDIQELTVGSGLTLSGGVLSADVTALQAQIDALNARLTALEQPNLSEGTPT